MPKDLPRGVPAILQKSLADLKEPKFSANGSRILCLEDDRLAILGLDGAVLQRIKPQKYPNSAQWGPGNHFIYYSAVDRLPVWWKHEYL